MNALHLVEKTPLSTSREKTMDESVLISWLRRENETLREEVEALRVYRRLAYRDPLTGLWNRRYADERLREEVQRASRQGDALFSVLVIDVNDFKHVNDCYGHVEGDRALEAVAAFLREQVREHDVCCRTGGDEFTVILGDTDEAGAAMLVDRLRRELGRLNRGRPWPIRLSIGQATWPEDGADADSLVGAADAAMYEDKERQKAGRAPTARRRDTTLPWMGGRPPVE